MKISRLISLILLLWPAVITLSAMDADTVVYTTDRLEAMGRALGLKSVKSPAIDTIAYNKLPVVVSIDANGRVSHVGYKLFSRSQRGVIATPAFDFVERYTLEAALPMERMRTLNKQLLEDDVNLTGCTLQTLPRLSSDTTLTVSVNNINGRRYRVNWLKGAKPSHSIEFPLSYDLLSGCDIDENERRLPLEIKAFTPTLDPNIPPELNLDETLGFYLTPGGSYFLDNLTSTRYFEEYEGEMEPLYDLDFPAHTVANLMTGTDIDNDFDIKVKFRKYDYKIDNFTVPVSQLVGYFLSQGCQPYFGVIKMDGGEIVGESLFVNHQMGYCHAMKITMRERDLIDRGGEINARLVSYIPVSKITNIFDEFK